MRNLRAFGAARDGASALEFAIILPVFVTMVLGTIQMGIVFFKAGSVQFALEEAAREVMVDPDMSASQIQVAIKNKLESLTQQDITVTYSVDSSGAIDVAQLNAQFNIEVVIPFVPGFSINFDAVTHIPLLS